MFVCIYMYVSISMFIFVIGRNQMKTVSVYLYGHGHSDCVIVRSHPVSGLEHKDCSHLSHDVLQDRYYIHTLLRSVYAL